MSIQIVGIRLDGEKEYPNITHFKYIEQGGRDGGVIKRDTLVRWIKGEGLAYVGEGGHRILIKIVWTNSSETDYVRTEEDGQETNNLLALPTFELTT
jgi:hypothetical protein